MSGRPRRVAAVAAERDDARARVERHHGVVRDVLVDDRVRADLDVVADADRAEHARAGPDVDVVAQGRRAFALAFAGDAEAHALRERAARADRRARADGDAAEV